MFQSSSQDHSHNSTGMLAYPHTVTVPQSSLDTINISIVVRYFLEHPPVGSWWRETGLRLHIFTGILQNQCAHLSALHWGTWCQCLFSYWWWWWWRWRCWRGALGQVVSAVLFHHKVTLSTWWLTSSLDCANILLLLQLSTTNFSIHWWILPENTHC